MQAFSLQSRSPSIEIQRNLILAQDCSVMNKMTGTQVLGDILNVKCLVLQIQGTGNGAGQDPVSTAPYIAVINNVCPQCAPGDLDLQVSALLSHLKHTAWASLHSGVLNT